MWPRVNYIEVISRIFISHTFLQLWWCRTFKRQANPFSTCLMTCEDKSHLFSSLEITEWESSYTILVTVDSPFILLLVLIFIYQLWIHLWPQPWCLLLVSQLQLLYSLMTLIYTQPLFLFLALSGLVPWLSYGSGLHWGTLCVIPVWSLPYWLPKWGSPVMLIAEE